MKKNREQILELRSGICPRCYIEKEEIVSFFFDWRMAAGKYSLCSDCLEEMSTFIKNK